MEEGLNCNTAPRRRVQWLDSNDRSSSHRGRATGVFHHSYSASQMHRGGERKCQTPGDSQHLHLHHPGLPGIAANRSSKVPTAPKAESTILSMEFSYFCLASPSWDDLKGFIKKYILLYYTSASETCLHHVNLSIHRKGSHI